MKHVYLRRRITHLPALLTTLVTCAVTFTVTLAMTLAAASAHAQAPTQQSPPPRPADPKQTQERTSFQTGAPWDPMIQLRSDVVMCYGIGPDIGDRVAQWRAQGYRVHVMTGVAWGNYQDYLYGRFDGIDHQDEAQTEKNGNKIGHGGDVYYMSPGINYGKFLTQGVKRALDAGAEAIHLEEPEFWVRAGWSKGFQREWKDYYHEDWVAPDSSPTAQYRASELKYYLYRRALTQVFDFVKDYNRIHHTSVRCYVPTHSLINYASWGIVSPESSLVDVGADGYIAQVWTGTARTPNVYEGREKERTFETAFLEYGVLTNIVRNNGKTLWFLNDPIEDNPDHSWRDYKTNWESTLTASLLWPQVARYEVMPWPERIFHGTYPTQDASERKAGDPVNREPIPTSYSTELMTVINTLNDMDQRRIEWDCGTQGIGVVVSDTMLFQRFGPSASDPHLGSLYGLAMPLLKRGIPVEPVQLEQAAQHGTLSRYKVLLMTYEGMKPMQPEHSRAIADWVKSGGILVFVDDDKDPFAQIPSWWNTTPLSYANPRQALFAQLGIDPNTAAGTIPIGKGSLIFDSASPAALTYNTNGGEHIRSLVRAACTASNLTYRETNYLLLRRGPYIIGSGLDESTADTPKLLAGRFVDLFDPALTILTSVTLDPGSRRLLLDLDKAPGKSPAILAAACKTLGATTLPNGGFQFYAEAPDKTIAAIRLRLKAAPAQILIDNQPLPPDAQNWDADTKTLLIHFPNSAQGHWITLNAR